MIAMVDGVVIDDKLERADPKPIKGGPMTKHLRVLRRVLYCFPVSVSCTCCVCVSCCMCIAYGRETQFSDSNAGSSGETGAGRTRMGDQIL